MRPQDDPNEPLEVLPAGPSTTRIVVLTLVGVAGVFVVANLVYFGWAFWREAASTGPGKGVAAWTSYSSPEGRFSVTFPAPPGPVGDNTVMTVNGKLLLKMITATPDRSRVAYAVMWGDYPASDAPGKEGRDRAEEFFENGGRALTGPGKGTMQRQAKLSLGNYPGREYWVQLSDNRGDQRVRAYLVKNRIYMVMVTGMAGTTSSPDAEPFFKSFQVSEAAASPP